MPTIKYPKNPNIDTAFVEQEDGTKNRALMTAPQDISTLEYPNNPNSTKGYVTVNGKKQRVILTADIAGGGGSDPHNLGFYADLTALQTAHPTGSDGDFAILGSTDTVWVWDSGTSAWKDTDTKGQVTSVNGQTGAVTVSEVPDQTGQNGKFLTTNGTTASWATVEAIQVSTMPTAAVGELGKVYQFIGTTDANYTHGYFYKCVSDGQTPATYSWVQTNVQPAPSGLPSQTGQSGKFLTTDGTDASWSDKPLVNTATGTNALTVGGVASTYNQVTNIGLSSQAYSYNNVLVGYNTSAYRTSVAIGNGADAGGASPYQKQGNVSIGFGSRTRGDYSIALGYSAKADADGAIQISATSVSANQTNSDANTFKVGNANGNFEIMSADGTIPTARLTKANTTVTLAVADWSSSTQTVNVTGMTATGVVFVSPDPTDQSAYTSAGIYCSAQAAGTLTFSCDTVPSADIDVNVVML